MRILRTLYIGAAVALLCGSTALSAPSRALELARQAEQNGDPRLASLYYFNAMASDHTSLEALKAYAAMIERNAAGADDPQTVAELYGSLLSLAQQQAAVVSPALIPQLSAFIAELPRRQAETLKRFEEVPDEPGPSAADATQELKSAFAAFIRNEGDAAELQNGLNDAIAAARAFPNEKKLRQMADIAEQTVQKTLDQRAFAVSLEQIRELLARLERETAPAHFDVIAATVANGIAALVLQKDKAAPEQLAELKVVEAKHKALVQQFYAAISRATATELETAAAKINSGGGTKTRQIERYTAHLAEVQKRAQDRELTVDDALRLSKAANEALIRLGEERLKEYNRWALEQIENALNSDYKKIKNDGRSLILRAYFADIDPRYLEPNVQRAYGEVFAHFYNHRDFLVKNKLEVDKEMTNTAKKKLEDF